MAQAVCDVEESLADEHVPLRDGHRVFGCACRGWLDVYGCKGSSSRLDLSLGRSLARGGG